MTANASRAERFGIRDLNRKYMLTDLASGDVVFSATGVTGRLDARRRAMCTRPT
jgi:fructose-1,6-bisphosphatase/sedoheptulose 1,7-bisphosphatase-like protein